MKFINTLNYANTSKSGDFPFTSYYLIATSDVRKDQEIGQDSQRYFSIAVLFCFSLFQAPRKKRAGEDEGTKTRGTGGEKEAFLSRIFLSPSPPRFRPLVLSCALLSRSLEQAILFPLAETCKVYAPEHKIQSSDNVRPQIKKEAHEARFTDSRIETSASLNIRFAGRV